MKNPAVDTSFLPDRDREERERIEREELRKEWLARQDKMKNETIEVTYSYWDGSGHRKSVEVNCPVACRPLSSWAKITRAHSARRETTSGPSWKSAERSFRSFAVSA